MNRTDLIQALSNRLRIPEHSAQVFLHAFFDSAKAALRTGDPLRFEGLGTWTPTLHADGTLASVTFEASGISDAAHVSASGPASSIDAMHFIPADALERGSVPQAGAMIDIAEVVDEVQKSFRTAQGNGVPAKQIDANPGAPTVESAPRTDDAAPMDLSAPHPDALEEYAFAQDTDTASEELPLDLSGAEYDTDEDFVDAQNTEDARGDASRYALEAVRPGEDESTDPEPLTRGSLTILTEENDATAEREDESEEDDAVFYRNRDQLYNPPEERNKRPLLIVALVLTAAMIIIILTIVFGNDERPELPGASSGRTPAVLQNDAAHLA